MGAGWNQEETGMTHRQIIVVGGNFAGLTAALELKHTLGEQARVHVISASDWFVFNPSLIWMPFGMRKAEELGFPLEQTFHEHGVEFTNAEVTFIDPQRRTVTAGGRAYAYDHLVLATGFRNDFSAVAGLGPDGHTQTITTVQDAEAAGHAWQKFLDDPGPVVIAAAQGASCFGAAYEFLFNVAYQLRRAKLRSRVSLTFLTAEPFVGHFGIGGLPGGERLLQTLLKKEGIEVRTEVALAEAGGDQFVLTDGSTVPFRYAMVIPPFVGQDVVRAVPRLADARGYVLTDSRYRSEAYPQIHAAGIAAAVPAPWQTAIPVGVAKTGFPTERMARAAAADIVATMHGFARPDPDPFGELPAVCLMDAGRNGVMILADHMLPPRRAGVMIPGPQVHAMKLGFEKYYLWKARHGYVRLP
jgi:sulfide:quinone oxidoreductase